MRPCAAVSTAIAAVALWASGSSLRNQRGRPRRTQTAARPAACLTHQPLTLDHGLLRAGVFIKKAIKAGSLGASEARKLQSDTDYRSPLHEGLITVSYGQAAFIREAISPVCWVLPRQRRPRRTLTSPCGLWPPPGPRHVNAHRSVRDYMHRCRLPCVSV